MPLAESDLTDDVHEQGAAVMIQITHLGRRTSWDKDDWLPVVSPSHVREPAHRAFPKEMEDWDIARVIEAYADAAERVKAGGSMGSRLECYGHLIDQFWSPPTNTLDGRLWRRARQPPALRRGGSRGDPQARRRRFPCWRPFGLRRGWSSAG